MEEKIMEILMDVDEAIKDYTGDNLYEDGLLDSFAVIGLVAELEEAFGVEIDAEDVIEENFKTVSDIINLMKKIVL